MLKPKLSREKLEEIYEHANKNIRNSSDRVFVVLNEISKIMATYFDSPEEIAEVILDMRYKFMQSVFESDSELLEEFLEEELRQDVELFEKG